MNPYYGKIEFESVALSLVQIWFLAFLSFSQKIFGVFFISDIWISFLFLMALLPGLVSHWLAAIHCKQLPAKREDEPEWDSLPKHNHVSGLGAASIVLFIMVIVTLGLWAASADHRSTISTNAGLLAFGASAIASRLTLPTWLAKLWQLVSNALFPIGTAFSVLDSWLVFPVASSVGASAKSEKSRYILLGLTLIPTAILGWFLDAPYGLLPMLWAFIAIIAIARRWSWIEDDRELAMLSGRFTGKHLRIGFKQDLRDEALVCFIAMLFLMPLVMRQAHLSFDNTLFALKEGSSANNLWAWVSFFGTELAKAVPFVDWAEIYQVEGDAPIEMAKTIGPSQHVVFSIRVVVDLILLAALLQAISISARTAKQKQMFFEDGTLDRLDPFIEPAEFKKLVTKVEGEWAPLPDAVQVFPRYNSVRLAELAGSKDVRIKIAAKSLQKRDGEVDLNERLQELFLRKKPNADQIEEVVMAIRVSGSQKEISILNEARRILNRQPDFTHIRVMLVDLIGDSPLTDERCNILSEVLSGPTRWKDSHQEVRKAALIHLERCFSQKNEVALQALTDASKTDTSLTLRAEAAARLETLQRWLKAEEFAKGLIED